eukprot:COSAG02_NODE_49790_length_324_cov_1.386667_1_plen_26_part_10
MNERAPTRNPRGPAENVLVFCTILVD